MIYLYLPDTTLMVRTVTMQFLAQKKLFHTKFVRISMVYGHIKFHISCSNCSSIPPPSLKLNIHTFHSAIVFFFKIELRKTSKVV